MYCLVIKLKYYTPIYMQHRCIKWKEQLHFKQGASSRHPHQQLWFPPKSIFFQTVNMNGFLVYISGAANSNIQLDLFFRLSSQTNIFVLIESQDSVYVIYQMNVLCQSSCYSGKLNYLTLWKIKKILYDFHYVEHYQFEPRSVVNFLKLLAQLQI